MQECYYVNPHNIKAFKKEIKLKIAIICRPDSFMKVQNCKLLIVETPRGIHNRCYLAQHNNISFLIVYGRFSRIRETSNDIDYELTQEAISFLGISIVIGTFVGGTIHKNDPAGILYLVDNYIGMGGYNNTRMHGKFKNVDMFEPFCPNAIQILTNTAKKNHISFRGNAIYACFHGYPRIETEAELNLYEKWGIDVVGQTLDVEATLAREAGCHYAAIVLTSDDFKSRDLLKDEKNKLINKPSVTKEGRAKMFNLFLLALPELVLIDAEKCNCNAIHKPTERSRNFYYMPEYLCVDD